MKAELTLIIIKQSLAMLCNSDTFNQNTLHVYVYEHVIVICI